MTYAEMDIGNLDRAERWIERFVEAAPDHPELTWLRFSLLESRNDMAAAIEYLLTRRAEVVPQVHPFIDLSIAAAELRLGNQEAALAILEDLTPEQTGPVRYLFVSSQKALAQYELGLDDAVEETTDVAFEIVRELRSQGHNQAWLHEQEAVYHATRGQLDEAIMAIQSAYENGSRNVYGFSIFWVHDRLLGDDPRYQEIRRLVDEDVERMQREVNAEIEACKSAPADCVLAEIDDV